VRVGLRVRWPGGRDRFRFLGLGFFYIISQMCKITPLLCVLKTSIFIKISDFKNNTFKVERVPNIFENLNSFETMLKMLKMMQIY